MTDLDRRPRREAVVIEHMQSENVQEWDRTMATFGHARYELPDGTVKSRLFRARAEVAKKIRERHESRGPGAFASVAIAAGAFV